MKSWAGTPTQARNIREETQKYISGSIAKKKQKLYAIYCMPDHTHLLVGMEPDVAVFLSRTVSLQSY